MNPKQQGTALRAIARAVEESLTVTRPSCLDIYGRGLTPAEMIWLVEAMPDARIERTPSGAEDIQLVGTVTCIGRVVRVLLVAREHAGAIGDLALVLSARAVAKVGAR